MRPADASSHQGPFKAGRLLPDDVHRQPAYRRLGRVRRPGLPGAARHSLWLRLPAGTDCPFLKFEFARQQEPSARRLSAAEAAALRCRSVASRGGAVGVLAGASRRLARRRPARVSAPGRVCHLRLVAAAQSVRR